MISVNKIIFINKTKKIYKLILLIITFMTSIFILISKIYNIIIDSIITGIINTKSFKSCFEENMLVEMEKIKYENKTFNQILF